MCGEIAKLGMTLFRPNTATMQLLRDDFTDGCFETETLFASHFGIAKGATPEGRCSYNTVHQTAATFAK